MQHPLTPPQEHVLALISGGCSITAAAQAAKIHRNTVHHWVATHSEFRIGLLQAREAKAVYWREEASELAATAIDTVRAILTDSTQPAAVRLKAAQSILAFATTPVLSAATSVTALQPANPWVPAQPLQSFTPSFAQPQPDPDSPTVSDSPAVSDSPTVSESPTVAAASAASAADWTPSESVLHSAQPVAQSQPSTGSPAVSEPSSPTPQTAGDLQEHPDRELTQGIGISAFTGVHRQPISSWLIGMISKLCSPSMNTDPRRSPDSPVLPQPS